MPFFSDEQEIKAARLREFGGTAFKYGLAMIILVLNNYISGFLFLVIVEVPMTLLGFDLSEGTDAYYFAVFLVNELSAYLLPVIVFAVMFMKERADFTADRTYKRIPAESLLLFLAGIGFGSAGSIMTNVISSVIDSVFGTGPIPDAFNGLYPGNTFQFAVFAFCICFIAPICEEFIFRELLLKPMRRFNDMAAAIVTGLIFGLYHGNFDQFAYAALLGFFYSVLAVRANSIVPSIIFHAINNIMVCTATYLPSALPEAEPVSNAFGTALDLMLPLEIAAAVTVIARGCLRLHSHDRFVTGGEIARMLIRTPSVIIGLIVMIAVFFLNV